MALLRSEEYQRRYFTARSAAALAARSADSAAVLCPTGSGGPDFCAAGFGAALSARFTMSRGTSGTDARPVAGIGRARAAGVRAFQE
jgi:hypothetical protein